jgi:hypothetical protein
VSKAAGYAERVRAQGLLWQSYGELSAQYFGGAEAWKASSAEDMSPERQIKMFDDLAELVERMSPAHRPVYRKYVRGAVSTLIGF